MRHLCFLLLLTACNGPSGDDDSGGSDKGGNDDPYAGLPSPATPAAYSGGTCPDLSGDQTDFESNGLSRSFLMHLPDEPQGAGVLFLWHGNGDSASNFSAYMGAAGLADSLDAIVIVPEAGAGGLGIVWGVPPNNSLGDVTLFEDVLSCLHEQYDADLHRVYTAGFSAGALWSSYLTMTQADHLAAAVIFSGGSDGSVGIGPAVNPYVTPSWKIPVVMTHGGQSDNVTVAFNSMTISMTNQLRADGHTAIMCPHGNGHTIPGDYASWAWDFLDAHVYGDTPSPYDDGDPSGALPAYCTWD